MWGIKNGLSIWELIPDFGINGEFVLTVHNYSQVSNAFSTIALTYDNNTPQEDGGNVVFHLYPTEDKAHSYNHLSQMLPYNGLIDIKTNTTSETYRGQYVTLYSSADDETPITNFHFNTIE